MVKSLIMQRKILAEAVWF